MLLVPTVTVTLSPTLLCNKASIQKPGRGCKVITNMMVYCFANQMMSVFVLPLQKTLPVIKADTVTTSTEA